LVSQLSLVFATLWIINISHKLAQENIVYIIQLPAVLRIVSAMLRLCAAFNMNWTVRVCCQFAMSHCIHASLSGVLQLIIMHLVILSYLSLLVFTCRQSPVYTPEMFKQLQEWVQPARVELLLTDLWSQNDDTTDTATAVTALTTSSSSSSSSNSVPTQLLHTVTTAADFHSAVKMSSMGDTTGGSIVNWYISAHNDCVLTAIEPLSSGLFSALLVDGIPAKYTDQLTMLLLGGGSSSSGAYTFRCGGLQYPIPQEACQLSALSITAAAAASTTAATAGEHSDDNSVKTADAQVSVLDNLLAQRGVARHSMPGVSNWLLNSTLDLFCNSSSSSSNSDGNTTLYWFSNSYSSATGLPTAGSSTASTIAAAVAVLLLNADGPEGASEYPPISHAVIFVLMICELIFALGIGKL
jgi:hypothetical protein